jgi:hypothetical protein
MHGRSMLSLSLGLIMSTAGAMGAQPQYTVTEVSLQVEGFDRGPGWVLCCEPQQVGGLMAYGPSVSHLWHRAGLDFGTHPCYSCRWQHHGHAIIWRSRWQVTTSGLWADLGRRWLWRNGLSSREGAS